VPGWTGVVRMQPALGTITLLKVLLSVQLFWAEGKTDERGKFLFHQVTIR
jgi:hypothetical protein